jgi:hypothetical protein
MESNSKAGLALLAAFTTLAAPLPGCGGAGDAPFPATAPVISAAPASPSASSPAAPSASAPRVTLGTPFVAQVATVLDADTAIADFVFRVGNSAEGVHRRRIPVESGRVVLRSDGRILMLDEMHLGLGATVLGDGLLFTRIRLGTERPVPGLVLESSPSALRAKFQMPLVLRSALRLQDGTDYELGESVSREIAVTITARADQRNVTVQIAASADGRVWDLGVAGVEDASVTAGFGGQLSAPATAP